MVWVHKKAPCLQVCVLGDAVHCEQAQREKASEELSVSGVESSILLSSQVMMVMSGNVMFVSIPHVLCDIVVMQITVNQ